MSFFSSYIEDSSFAYESESACDIFSYDYYFSNEYNRRMKEQQNKS